ncbi:gamma-butyrobetaine dioxygenase isoform X1 [Lingula anatina]|uniref:Gamma-butyrobetaine dioxygenase isoform X1 n=1 Tax=Lingula anatina TaxID=7574 RepID=A0A1S3H2U8_LINAN|nr:gamma-butyrobetaine dioxygenase isoform X1 [Lingula anatina]|eukprot:XP_013379806.1 gamma-butyrobetaine dioxygenase isoform X1 [Lingula anatina]
MIGSIRRLSIAAGIWPKRWTLCSSAIKRSFQRPRPIQGSSTVLSKYWFSGPLTRTLSTMAQVSSADGSHCTAKQVKLNDENKCVRVTWGDGKEDEYPYVWLRDNCQCPECFVSSSASRAFLMANLDPDVKPKNVQADDDYTVTVTWEDGHNSSFKADWLLYRSFSSEQQHRRLRLYRPEWKHWGANEMQGKIPQFAFGEVMSEDRSLHDFLHTLDVMGLVMLKNTPTMTGQLEKLGKRIAYLRPTNYETVFTVINRNKNANNLAYTRRRLGLHMDLPFYEYSPEIQLLHCIKQADGMGGSNEFVDGPYVAKQLRDLNPEAYKTLTTTLVDFYDVGEEAYKFNFAYRWPVIALGRDGEPESIFYNDQVRAYQLNIPAEEVYGFYKALKEFHKLMYDPKNIVEVKMEEGDIVCFANKRVLHGRTGYENVKGERHLEGAYFDWDEVRSRVRVLKRDLNIEP